MATKVLLIDEQYVRDFSTFDLNVDSRLILPSIAQSQDKYILQLLGTGLYNEIVNQISGSTLSTANELLLNEYVKECLAAYTIYECSDFLLYKFTNKGIEKQTSDNSQPISRLELDGLKSKLLDSAQYYAERVNRFLLANTNTYPLYLQPGSGIDTIYPTQKNYDFGIHLEQGSKNKKWGFQGSKYDY